MKQAEPQWGFNKMQIKLEVTSVHQGGVCLSVVWTHIEENGGKKVTKLNKLMITNQSIN